MTRPAPGWYPPSVPLKCPICETDNGDDAYECATCGKALVTDADLLEDIAPIDGLEQTIHDPLESATGPVQALAELEQTMIARKDLAVVPEVVPGVEHTWIEEDPNALSHWSAGALDLERGRELDDGVRTPAPVDNGLCPWCNSPATGAVCDNCGRRRSRYSAPAAAPVQAAPGEDVLCPACFARVPPGARCVECSVPFAVVEL